MSDYKSKLGIFIIVVILAVTGILIVTKTRQEQSPVVMTSTVTEPGEEYMMEEDLASSSSLSSPIPMPASIEEYAYPNAKKIESDSQRFVLESSDSAQLITDWYKNKINSMNFNAKSFTQTNSNGEVLNKISAARPGENLEVTIKKYQTTSTVEITVDRS